LVSYTKTSRCKRYLGDTAVLVDFQEADTAVLVDFQEADTAVLVDFQEADTAVLVDFQEATMPESALLSVCYPLLHCWAGRWRES
jgi:hypothetical protein